MRKMKHVEQERSTGEGTDRDFVALEEAPGIESRVDEEFEQDPLALWEDQFLPYQVGPIEEHYLASMDHLEIEAAIKGMSEQRRKPVRERIVVMPTTIEFKYEHTCSRCGCHVGAIPGTSFGGSTWICAYCDHGQWSGGR